MGDMLVRPLKIGKLTIGLPLLQAPLSGYSDLPMRRLAREFGASFTVCEVFLDQFVLNVSKKNKSRFYLAVDKEDKPTGAQLMGSSSEELVLAALKLLEYGFDLIDLNFACPVKKVVGRSRGGYLLSNPLHAIEIARRVREAIIPEIPVTVKLRKGFDDTVESRKKFFELLSGLLDVGIDAITVHGRTVLQRYQGNADWDFLRDVKEFVSVKKNRPEVSVIGCGDLFSAETVIERMRESNVDGVALARGIIGNPWLFTQTRAVMEERPVPAPPTLQEQKDTIIKHFQAVLHLYGESKAPTIMRKFGIAYSRLHPDSENVRIAFVLCKTPEQWFDVLNKYY